VILRAMSKETPGRKRPNTGGCRVQRGFGCQTPVSGIQKEAGKIKRRMMHPIIRKNENGGLQNSLEDVEIGTLQKFLILSELSQNWEKRVLPGKIFMFVLASQEVLSGRSFLQILN